MANARQFRKPTAMQRGVSAMEPGRTAQDWNSVNPPYQLSRAAMRDRYGPRAIKGAGNNSFSPRDTTPSARALRPGTGEPGSGMTATPQDVWDNFFNKPTARPSLAPTVAPDVGFMASLPEVGSTLNRPIFGGGTLDITQAAGGQQRTIRTPYGNGSSFLPTSYLERTTSGANRALNRNSPIARSLRRNNGRMSLLDEITNA